VLTKEGSRGSSVYQKTWVRTSGRGECDGIRVGGEYRAVVWAEIGEGVESGCLERGEGVCL
jgi:hypothetical protein